MRENEADTLNSQLDRSSFQLALEISACFDQRKPKSGGRMENGQKGDGTIKPTERYDVGHVQVVIRRAHDELRGLMQQRADIMKRIGTAKRTIAGLANLFGDGVLSDELMELVDRKNSGRQPGFTNTCRMILMEADRPMSTRDICNCLQQKIPSLLARHKDLMASVTTVLYRLVDYGEAQAVFSGPGRRAWLWIAESSSSARVESSASDEAGELRCCPSR